MQPDTFYHIYTHSNGREDIFMEEENYWFFLERYKKHVQTGFETYAYCLMPNHMHFLIKTRSVGELELAFGKFETFQKLQYQLSKSFANLFSSYTQAFNKKYSRKGSLFRPNFKQKEITDDFHFIKVVHYIHANPIHHGFVKDIETWKWSSYQSILSTQPTLLERNKVLEWFGNRREFIEVHKQQVDLKVAELAG